MLLAKSFSSKEISVLKEPMNRYEETVPKMEDNAVAMADVPTAMEFDLDVTMVAINLPEKDTAELDVTVKRLLTETENPRHHCSACVVVVSNREEVSQVLSRCSLHPETLKLPFLDRNES